MYIVMISQNNFQIIQDKAEAMKLTEELAKTQKVYFFELKNVVETKLTWGKPSKNEKIEASIPVQDNELMVIPAFTLPINLNTDLDAQFLGVPESLPIQDQSFSYYPKIREYSTTGFNTVDIENSEEQIKASMEKLENIKHPFDEVIAVAENKEEIETLETENEKIESELSEEITQTFEVQEVSNNEALEPAKENEIVEKKVVEKVNSEASEERRFTLSIGKSTSAMSESNVKKQCETLFKEALEKENKLDALQDAKASLKEWYKNDNITEIEWFKDLYEKYKSLANEENIKDESEVDSLKKLQTLKEIASNSNYRVDTIERMAKSHKFQILSNTKYKDEYEKILKEITQKETELAASEIFNIDVSGVNK